MPLTEQQRRAVEVHIRYARELGIYDLYQRPVAAHVATAEQIAVQEAEPAAAVSHDRNEPAEVAAAGVPESSRLSAGEEDDIARGPLSIIHELPRQPFAGDKRAALHALQQEIGLCMRCPLALAGRHTVVFADGDPDAQLMFVGEGPGADEDEQGLPFVGRAGQLLNNMITAMGLLREQVYIANIVKCRPPKNRVPEPVEANTCLPFLARQMDIVQPKVVVALGATAALYLTGTKAPLVSVRGQLQDFRGAKLLVTYHPAYLLRDPNQKKHAWADLQVAMKYLGLRGAKKDA